MKRAWRNTVVVIVGASSGIGRATALMLAKKGAKLVLAARREEALESLAEECGGEHSCRVVPTDVSDAAAVRALADEAVRTFGHFDAWLNIAGVYCVGSLEETPEDAFRALMETNFFGTVNGSRAALAHFRRQGRGTLINTGSVFSRVTSPYVSAYVASKFAVRGFTSSLREELMGTDIHACTVLPAAIDTPLWQHTANYSGWKVQPPEPLYTPERVARAMVQLLVRPKAEVLVGPAGWFYSLFFGHSQRLFERSMKTYADQSSFKDEFQSHTSGNLMRPMAEGTAARGGFHSGARTWLRRLLLAGGALAVAARVRQVQNHRRLGWRLTHAFSQ